MMGAVQSTDTTFPIPDAHATAALRRSLRALDYCEESIEDVLGDGATGADEPDVPVYDRRLPASPLATAIRLFLLQAGVDSDDARAALGAPGVDALLAIGLAHVADGRIVPRARIVPIEGLLIASDGFARGADDPSGYVASFTPTASWCAALTPRRRVARALDVGTGNGAQALLAAEHSGHVIATDVNPRALAYTQLNAGLNGLDNIETRLGSLFDPVASEQFDLVTCNAPYVVSPETKWQYRDGGLPADRFSELVVTQAAGVLADDGYATLLVSWLAASEEEPDDRARAWVEGRGCDAWLLGLSGADPLDHASVWNDHLHGDAEALGAALDEWTAYFEDLGVGWITEGAVLLHRRSGGNNILRADPVDEEELEFAGEQVERVFAAHAFLAEHPTPDALFEATLALAGNVRVDRSFEPGGEQETTFVLAEGTFPELEVDPDTAEVIASLDGRDSLGDATEHAAKRLELTRRATSKLRRDVLDVATELLELGFLELR